MLRMELFIGGQVYRFASEPLDYGGYYWEPRINNPFEIQRVFSFTDKTGNRRRSVAITLDNNDKFFNSLHENYSLLNKLFTLYFDDGSNLTKKLVGTCNEITHFDLQINLSISEEINIFLDQPVPDAQIAYDYYSETGINESWNAVPIIFGYVKRYKVAWVNKVKFQFLIGSGEIYSVDKVYFDKYCMYDASTGLNAYQATPESNTIKVRVFRGGGSVGSPERIYEPLLLQWIDSDWTGFAYLQFYDSVTGLPVEPKMTDGKIPEIFVDVKGIINDARNDAERNPARILYKMMTFPTTGYNGWGLGIPSDKLNFSIAIGYCNSQSYYLDGVIDRKMMASEWIDEILQTFAGSVVENEGFFHLMVDKRNDVVSAEFDDTGELGHHCNIDGWEEPNLDSQINRLRLFYDLNYETGKFDKRPNINAESPCGSLQLSNSAHAVKIDKWNSGTQEFALLKDDLTAHKIAVLYFRRDILQLKTITFLTEQNLDVSLDAGQKIKVSSAKFDWVQKEFTIKEIIKGEKNTRITAREYYATVYDFTNDLTITPLSKPQYGSYDIPLKPINLGVTQSTDVANDGKLVVTLNLHAEKVGSNVSEILFYRRRVGDPSFAYFTATTTNDKKYIWDREDGNYEIRAVAKTPYGVTSALTIATGDSHYIGWNVPPYVELAITILTQRAIVTGPNAPTLTVYFKIVRVLCKQPATKLGDLAGFVVYRNTIADPNTSTEVGRVMCQGKYEDVILLDDTTAYGATYYYWTKTINTTAQLGPFSGTAGPVTTYKIQTFDVGPLAIELGQVAPGAITGTNIQDCAISTPKLAAYAVVAGKIAACEISSFHVGTNKLIANCANICDLVVVDAHIRCIHADKIYAGCICADRINAGYLSIGTVGGWQMTSQCLWSGGVGMASDNTGSPAFWAGCSARDSAPFRAYQDGNIYINNAGSDGSKSYFSLSNTSASPSYQYMVQLLSCGQHPLFIQQSSTNPSLYGILLTSQGAGLSINSKESNYFYNSGGSFNKQAAQFSSSTGDGIYVVGADSCYGIRVSATGIKRGIYIGHNSCGIYSFGCCYSGVFQATDYAVYAIATNNAIYTSVGSGFAIQAYGQNFTINTTAFSNYAVNASAVNYTINSLASCEFAVRATALNYAVHATTGGSYSLIGLSPNVAIYGCSTNSLGVMACSSNNSAVGAYAGGSGYGIYAQSAMSFAGFFVSLNGNGIYASATGVGNYAVGGNTAYCNLSSFNIKRGFGDINVLERLKQLQIKKWTYHDRNNRSFHDIVGPIAEEWSSIMGLNFGSEGISGVDGVALKASQELLYCVEKQEKCILGLQKETNNAILSLNERIKLLEGVK